MKISVIIIVFNEEGYIGQCIASLKNAADKNGVDMLVVDGGSTDRTCSIAADLGVKVLQSRAGRGRQCQRGAESAEGDILVFLHGDSRFPVNGFSIIRQYFKNEHVNVATFGMQFDSSHPLLKIYSFFSRFDSIFSSFGDQGVVVRKTFHDQIGGFPSWLLFEDVHFLRKARKVSKIISLPAHVITSSRRFQAHGIVRQQIRNFFYILRYLMGVPGDVLSQQYRRDGKDVSLSALVIMVKYPVPGRVKTRLAITIGNVKACLFYRYCAEQCMREAKKIAHSKRFLFYTGTDNKDHMLAWVGAGFDLIQQQGESLGQRLDHAFKLLFSRGFKKVVILGSDVPDMGANIVDDALAILSQKDVVIGPSRDGGYYLIGMKTHLPQLFKNMVWSTDQVLSQTLATIEKSALSWALLPELIDIDTEDDFNHWLRQISPKHPLMKKLQLLLHKGSKVAEVKLKEERF